MKIVELRLGSSALPQQRTFYTEVLGLPLVEATPQSFSVRAGETTLVFGSVAEPSGPSHFAFNIPENKLGEAKRWLSGSTPLLREENEDEFFSQRWNAHMVYFRDADGNILELVARHDLHNATEEAFTPAGILSVSEIGWPVNDVVEGATWLRDTLAIQTFRETSTTFVPLGDPDGLFIVVPVGRPWFPTEEQAVVTPLTVVLDSAWTGEYRFPGLPYLIRSTGAAVSS